MPGGRANDARIARQQDIINAGKYEMEHGKFAPRNSSAGGSRVEYPKNGGKSENWQQNGHQEIAPDAPPTFTEFDSRKRFSYEYTPSQTYSAEQTQEKEGGSGRIGRWLHKARSHPSDREQGENLRENENGGARLKKGNRARLDWVQE